MRCASFSVSTVSNKHRSTLVACSENNAKFTPLPSHVAPSGYEFPGQTRMVLPPVQWYRAHVGSLILTRCCGAQPVLPDAALSSKLHATIAQGGWAPPSLC